MRKISKISPNVSSGLHVFMNKICMSFIYITVCVYVYICIAPQSGASGKEPACQCRRHKRWPQTLRREDPLEEGMAPYSSTLAWRIPWTEEPGGSSPWGCKELDTTEQEHTVLTQCIIFWVQDNFFFSFSLVFFNHAASQDMCGDNFLKTFFFHLKF